MSRVTTTEFVRDLQNLLRRLSSDVPKPESFMPYASILCTSRGMGDCQSPSHQADGRIGVRAHWRGCPRQLRGPANRFHTCPHPICLFKPSKSNGLWKLLRNVMLEFRDEFSSVDRIQCKFLSDHMYFCWMLSYSDLPSRYAAASAAIS